MKASDTHAAGTGNGAIPPQSRVVVRPLATPLPLGLYSFGIGMLMLAAQSGGWVAAKDGKQVGLVIASFVFPLEGTATVFAFLARDTLAATVLGLFSTSWLTVGLALLTSAPGASSPALGFYLVAFAAAIAALALVATSGEPVLALILTLSASRAIVDGIYQFSAATGVEHAAGYIAAAIAGLAWYAGTAMVLEDVRQRPILPMFRRGASKTALQGRLAEQLAQVGGEAGVRRPL